MMSSAEEIEEEKRSNPQRRLLGTIQDDEETVKQQWLADLRCTMVEATGTLFFVFIAAAIITDTAKMTNNELTAARLLSIGLTQGLAYGILCYMCDIVSGGRTGFLNPVVTLALAVINGATKSEANRRGRWPRPWRLCGLYLVAQFTSAIIGAFCASACVPNALQIYEKIGTTKLGYGESTLQGFFMELVLTVFFIFVLLACVILKGGEPSEIKRRSQESVMELMSVMSLVAAIASFHLVAFPFTGCSMNPARSMGAAIASMQYTNLWIYFVSPPLGAILGSVCYVVFFTHLSLKKAFSSLYCAVEDVY
eukprot:GILJ01001596.1.p1 GENE.GILJ01001596.1~~GILJ01001596.1.p1  ORF type:complete len:309 (-),score=45.54 GILJ01001596.1:169-1095(-)